MPTASMYHGRSAMAVTARVLASIRTGVSKWEVKWARPFMNTA